MNMQKIAGYLIPKGWKVQLWYRTVNLDPQSYPDPKKFKPSRWDVSRTLISSLFEYSVIHDQVSLYRKTLLMLQVIQDFVPKAGRFLPFGGGSRLCPGNDLAKLEISVFLHHFLLNYQ